MINKAFATLFALVLIVTACKKPSVDVPFIEDVIQQPTVLSNAILIDASKDGGTWWFPQSGKFSSTEHHQGKQLADYLRSLGYTVNEIPRGKSVTWSELKQYTKVIRVGGMGTYLPEEIAAYESLLKNSASLLLLTDHLKNFPNDALCVRLGLNFSGAETGNVTQFVQHAITSGVSSLPYIAGSVINQPNKNSMTILGYLKTYGQQDSGVAIMGILHHSSSKIFFIGDVNGIEQLPQPFTNNLVTWLFK